MKEIIKALENLLNVHEELLILSKEKTEFLKEGAVEELQKMIVKERKLVRKTEQAEVKRKTLVDAWCESHDLPLDEATVTNLLGRQESNEDRDYFERVTTALTKVLANLKAQEKLNFALINQSMQFVKVSLDLLSPTLKNMNYGNKSTSESPAHSIFDSKA